MLEGLKRLFTGGSAAARGWGGLVSWAHGKQYNFREVREGSGFIVEGRLGALPWRLEWGPSQRSYVEGTELRIRAELGVTPELQAVVMNRALQVKMESAVFEQYVGGVQTRIDSETPPEIRWLVMFPKLAASEMGKLQERYVALSSVKAWLMRWLDSPLAATLSAMSLPPATPFVLMIGRGRLTLRTQLGEPDAPELDRWLRLFEAALREARRVASEGADSSVPSTQPSMFSSTALPPDDDTK